MPIYQSLDQLQLKAKKVNEKGLTSLFETYAMNETKSLRNR